MNSRGITETHLLSEETAFLPESVDLLVEMGVGVATVSGSAAGAGQCNLGQGDGVDDRRADSAGVPTGNLVRSLS
jgi:hypothetical protein